MADIIGTVAILGKLPVDDEELLCSRGVEFEVVLAGKEDAKCKLARRKGELNPRQSELTFQTKSRHG